MSYNVHKMVLLCHHEFIRQMRKWKYINCRNLKWEGKQLCWNYQYLGNCINTALLGANNVFTSICFVCVKVLWIWGVTIVTFMLIKYKYTCANSFLPKWLL